MSNSINPLIHSSVNTGNLLGPENVRVVVSKLNMQTKIDKLQLPIEILKEIRNSGSGISKRRMKEYLSVFHVLQNITSHSDDCLPKEKYNCYHKQVNIYSVGWMLKMLNNVLNDNELAVLADQMSKQQRKDRTETNEALRRLEEIQSRLLKNGNPASEVTPSNSLQSQTSQIQHTGSKKRSISILEQPNDRGSKFQRQDSGNINLISENDLSDLPEAFLSFLKDQQPDTGLMEKLQHDVRALVEKALKDPVEKEQLDFSELEEIGFNI